MLPKNSVLHLGILNSLRSWNFFPIDPSIRCFANTGGFGIDGCMSSLVGASLVTPDNLFQDLIDDRNVTYTPAAYLTRTSAFFEAPLSK